MNVFLTGAVGYIGGARARSLLDWAPHAPSILDDLVHGSYHTETPSML